MCGRPRVTKDFLHVLQHWSAMCVGLGTSCFGADWTRASLNTVSGTSAGSCEPAGASERLAGSGCNTGLVNCQNVRGDAKQVPARTNVRCDSTFCLTCR